MYLKFSHFYKGLAKSGQFQKLLNCTFASWNNLLYKLSNLYCFPYDSFCVVSGQDDSNNAQYLENVTKTIGDLLEGYDIRLRPNFGGEN